MWNYHKHEEEYDRPDGSSRELEDNLRVGDVHEARTRVYNAFYINSLESLNLDVHPNPISSKLIMQLCDDIKIFLSLNWQPTFAILIKAIKQIKIGAKSVYSKSFWRFKKPGRRHIVFWIIRTNATTEQLVESP